jgi:hypothetical protein
VTQAHPLPKLQLVRLLHVRAAEKQKERISKAFGAYKQATPPEISAKVLNDYKKMRSDLHATQAAEPTDLF